MVFMLADVNATPVIALAVESVSEHVLTVFLVDCLQSSLHSSDCKCASECIAERLQGRVR